MKSSFTSNITRITYGNYCYFISNFQMPLVLKIQNLETIFETKWEVFQILHDVNLWLVIARVAECADEKIYLCDSLPSGQADMSNKILARQGTPLW